MREVVGAVRGRGLSTCGISRGASARWGRPPVAGRRRRTARSRRSRRLPWSARARHVDGVAQRLEGVERDAHRQHDVEDEWRCLDPGAPPEEIAQAVGEEPEILEEPEQAEVEGDRDGRPALLLAHARSGGGDLFGDEVIDHRRGDDQREEAVVPGAVEDVAGHQQHAVLGAVRQRAVEEDHHREEEPEDVAIEDHR